MYFTYDQRLEAGSSRVRASPSVHCVDDSDVECVPYVRSFTAARSLASGSRSNDKRRVVKRSTASRHHPYCSTATSPFSSSSGSPPAKVSVAYPSLSEAAQAAASHGRSILEYYAQTMPLSAACQSVQKRCSVAGCCKISVSRGLCRGHGGGRRCHFKDGCAKSAQSRSMFCWAHGGGQRCNVPECMRSRKSKRFCVAHLHLEEASVSHEQDRLGWSKPVGAKETRPQVPVRGFDDAFDPQDPMARLVGADCEPRWLLPSLRQALTDASRTLPNLPSRTPPRASSG